MLSALGIFFLEREKEREIENVAALGQIRGAISPK